MTLEEQLKCEFLSHEADESHRKQTPTVKGSKRRRVRKGEGGGREEGGRADLLKREFPMTKVLSTVSNIRCINDEIICLSFQEPRVESLRRERERQRDRERE
jgi:hypothetical protein